ncbi:hypothetical protein BsWGS_18165 [Bradybaena similaris]
MTLKFPSLWCVALVLLVTQTPVQCNDKATTQNQGKRTGSDEVYTADSDFPGHNQYDFPLKKLVSFMGKRDEDNAKVIENALLNNVPENDLNYPRVSKEHADKDGDDLNIDNISESKQGQHSSKHPSNGLRKIPNSVQSVVRERRDRASENYFLYIMSNRPLPSTIEELEDLLNFDYVYEPETQEPDSYNLLRYGKRNKDFDYILSENPEGNSDLHSDEQKP